MFENKEIVERIRTFCKENGTSITKLEEEFGWSNGYIGKWAKARKRPPIEKLSMIANRLNVLIQDLTGDEKSPTSEEIGPNKQAVLNAVENMDVPDLLELMQKVTEMIQKHSGSGGK